MMYYQQGDVLLMAAELPPNAERRETSQQITLAIGEATGHSHVAVGTALEAWTLPNGVRFLFAPEGATVQHQEHGVITLAPGTYQVGIVREYDHFAEEARVVMD